VVSCNGHVVTSFGGPKGSSSQEMNVAAHLAVDENDCVFVVDT